MSVNELIMHLREFLLENWKLILCFVVWFVMIIINLTKKKVKVVDTLVSCIYESLPSFIRSSEDFFGKGNGDLKKKFVIDSIITYLTTLSDLTESELISKYGKLISVAIENIMETPEKKKKER